MKEQTMEQECRDHWYGPSYRKPRRNASSKRRWAYTYQALATHFKTEYDQGLRH